MSRVKKVSQKQIGIDNKLNYLAGILVDAFFDQKVDTDPDFIDPRINKPIFDLVKDSKKREKDKKINKYT